MPRYLSFVATDFKVLSTVHTGSRLNLAMVSCFVAGLLLVAYGPARLSRQVPLKRVV